MTSAIKVNPLPIDDKKIETEAVLKKLITTHRYLAELKGKAKTIPNENILITTLALQEAKDSSEIENIITTHDDLYKSDLFTEIKTPAAKEVNNYAKALKLGFLNIEKKGVLTSNDIIDLQKNLEANKAGFRKLPGTSLKNDKTGEVIYTPPQSYAEIVELMSNLEKYINDDDLSAVDPLIKMAIIHLQFESIHPFYDGNGRTGRIINVLYLVLKDLLDIPILYLSRYITRNKDDYYRLLQKVRQSDEWEEWVLYMLEAVEQTSRHTISIIENMSKMMLDYKSRIRETFPKFYSQDLLNNLFKHPYTKIDYVKDELEVSRITAAKYLDMLANSGFLEKHSAGKYNYYINRPLLNLLSK